MGQPLLILLISILLANSIPAKGSRLLRQTNSILIDSSNADDLPALLRAASPGTNFQLTMVSLTLTQTLHFTTTDITFGGLSTQDRPILRCNTSLASEVGILVDVSGVKINNLVIEGCPGPVLRVVNRVVGPLNGSPNVLTLQNVAFFDNVQSSNRLGPFVDGGAMQITRGTRVTIRDCEFSRNEGVFGGAISLLGSASLIVFDSSFTDNTASTSGGAIFSQASAEASSANSRLRVRGCTFNRNADLGGSNAPSGLRLANGAPLESFVVLRFPIPESSAGGIYASNFDRVTITDSSFQNNSALTAGGAVFINSNRKVVIKDNTFIGNSAIGTTFGTSAPDLAQGGALYVAFSDERSEVEIRGCSFHRNSASYGGGIHLIGTLTTQASISDCKFSENTAALGGGGLLIRNIVQVPLVNVQFVQNSARLGGGLLVTNGGGVLLSQGIDASRNCLFSENEALDGAGCCFLAAGTSVGQAVAFNLNRATRHGGALAMIESAFGASIRFQDSTFSNNSARLGGAVYQDSAAAFQLLQTPYGTSFLSGNRALAGGALYLQPWSQVRNEIRITGTTIANNEALLSNEGLPPLRRPLPSVDLASVRDSELFVDNQIQSFACLPGGGGGICLSLIPLLPRALLRIEFGNTRIVQNEAINGGGIMISSSALTNCTESCPVVGDDIPVTISLCSGIQFDDLFLTRNEASRSGSAMILTESGVSQWTCPSV